MNQRKIYVQIMGEPLLTAEAKAYKSMIIDSRVSLIQQAVRDRVWYEIWCLIADHVWAQTRPYGRVGRRKPPGQTVLSKTWI